MKNSIKRAQSRAGSSFAERENFRPKVKHLKKTLLTLVALLAVTTGAWADDQSESFTTATNGQLTYTGEHFTISGQKADTDGLWIGNAGGSDFTVTISSRNGENITKIEAVLSYKQSWGDTKLATTSGEVTGTYDVGQTITISSVNATTVTLSGPEGEFKLIEFKSWTIYYGDAPTAVTVDWNKTSKTGTFTMPAGNVELQVEYYPGMLVKPTNLVGGTMEIEGLTDTTLPEGFEKDDDGNIYVAKDTKFTVKAVPAEGYHLVAWSDDATNKELEREFTMGDDDFILTATFSNEYDLAFNALNANTIEDGKATVKVGDTDKTADIQDGKLTGVKYGQTVTLTAKQGYKFRSVEAKKAGAVMTTVTWNSTNVFNSAHEDVELSKWSPTPLSYEGITISFSGTKTSSFQAYDEDDHIGSLTCYGNNGDSFTFTAPSGKKFCKIEIINNGFIVFTNYGDWTRDADNKIVWSGTAANAVTLGSVYTDADNLNSIVFYLSE